MLALTLTRAFNPDDAIDRMFVHRVNDAGQKAGLDVIKAVMAAKFADDNAVSVKDGTLCDKPMAIWDKWNGGVEATPAAIHRYDPAKIDDRDYLPVAGDRTIVIFKVREPVKGGWTDLFRKKLGFRDQLDILTPEWIPSPQLSKKWFGPFGMSAFHGTYEQQKQYGHFEVAVELPILLEHLGADHADYEAKVNAAECAKADELGLTLKQPKVAHGNEIVTVPNKMGWLAVQARYAYRALGL